MFKNLFARTDPNTPRDTTRRIDPRSGAPIRHHPDPMPRIRWYS
jgi:hypothetical protein